MTDVAHNRTALNRGSQSSLAPSIDNHRKGDLQDGGSRITYSTGAQKEDQNQTEGKGRYDLLPPTAIRRVADIFRKGAEKYTKDIPIDIDNAIGKMISSCTCNNENHIVIHILTTMLKGCAEIATNEILRKEIQILQNDNETTVKFGQQIIKNAKEILIKSTNEGQIVGSENHFKPDWTPLENWESHIKMLKKFFKNNQESVQSAKEFQKNDGLIQTTIIPQEAFEDFYVLNVTKELDFLEIISKVLIKHFSTCKIHQVVFFQNNQAYEHYEGDRNWEKGLPLSRLLDSAKRHLDQYQEGMEDEDHLAQAAWNLLALLHTEEMIKRCILSDELDDLPSYQPINTDNSMWRQPGRFFKEDIDGEI